jgi:hypothetical protein
METQHQFDGPRIAFPHVDNSTSLLISAAIVAALSAAALCATGNYTDAVIIAAMVSGAAALVKFNVPVEAMLVAWFVTTPLASFYLRAPLERSIITCDRVAFGLMLVLLILKRRHTDSANSTKVSAVRSFSISITKFEAAWALLSIAVLASVAANSYNPAYAARMAIDAFWLPLVAFHIARRHLDLRRSGKALLIGAIALALFLFAVGAVEFVTARDLFHFKGSEIIREGERRVNGPFISDSSYSIICSMLFLFLLSARRLLKAQFDRAGKLFYYLAVAAAAAAAMLPMFRAVAASLLIGLLVLQLSGQRVRFLSRHSAPALLILVMIVLIGAAAIFTPLLLRSGRISDPRTAFARLATWQAAAVFTLSNPAFGVGLGNYAEYFREKHFYRDESIQDVFDARAADTPHSNLLWIGSELGLIGLVLYLAANVYLFSMGWRALKRASLDRERTAAACFLALLAAYWIPGLTLASGEYSDLNLYFLFLLGALSSQFSRSSQLIKPRNESAD